MLIFIGFQTCGMIEQTVLNNYINETTVNGTVTFHGDGYISLAIIYIVFAFCNWIAPSIVSLFGPKYTMVIGSLAYVLYLASFIKPLVETLYISSVLVGFGAAILWTAQGNFLTLNSTKDTMSRNSGLFWAISQTSFLIGNLYVFFAWNGVTQILDAQRIPLFIGLTVLTVIGTLSLFILRTSKDNSSEEENLIERENEMVYSSRSQAYVAFIDSIKLFKTRDMVILSVTFFYTGLELTFYSGVYSTCVGATKQFGDDADKLVGLVGIMIGVGEIAGGMIFGIFGSYFKKYGHGIVVLLGGVLHFVSFLLIFLNIPDDAPISTSSSNAAYIMPNSGLAIFCGLLLGFCDACYNTQVISIIGTTYPDQSAPAFALFKFVQSFSAAIGFFYSPYLSLKWQLLILVIFNFLSMIAFFNVENNLHMKKRLDDGSADIPS